MNNQLLTFFLILIISFGCEVKKEEKASIKEEKQPVSSFSSEFQEVLDAHGGLDRWNSFSSLAFIETNAKGDSMKHTIDLRSREEVAEKLGVHKVVYANDTILLSSPDAMTMDRAKFYKNLMFYFFGIPFVTADDGVNQELMEPATLNGTTFDRIKITFNDGVGDSPKDEYILWLDQADHSLEVLNYSVTYFDESKSSQYNAIVYGDWQNINGLNVPGSLTWHKWEGDSLGESRHQVRFSDIIFSRERPNREIFKL